MFQVCVCVLCGHYFEICVVLKGKEFVLHNRCSYDVHFEAWIL